MGIIEQLSPAMQNEYELLVGPVSRTPREPDPGPESFAAFARRHGEWIKVIRESTMETMVTGEPTERFWFLDGAQSDGQLRHVEPPDDQWDRVALQRRYLVERIRQETVAWNTFHQDCLNLVAQKQEHGNLPGPPHNAVEQLEWGKAKIGKYKRMLAALPSKPKTEREEALERMRERAADESQREIDAIRRISL